MLLFDQYDHPIQQMITYHFLLHVVQQHQICPQNRFRVSMIFGDDIL